MQHSIHWISGFLRPKFHGVPTSARVAMSDSVTIYVRPPEGYGKPGMVAKLHKSVGAYVDDLLITGGDVEGIKDVKAQLKKRFRVSDRSVKPDKIHQRHLKQIQAAGYSEGSAEDQEMTRAKGGALSKASIYRGIVGSLLWLSRRITTSGTRNQSLRLHQGNKRGRYQDRRKERRNSSSSCTSSTSVVCIFRQQLLGSQNAD